jgi:hypothetical protein
MDLGLTQPLTEMSTRNNSWGVKAAVGLTTLPHSCVDCLEIWEPQPSGTLRACPGLFTDCFLHFWLRFLKELHTSVSDVKMLECY